MLCYGAGFRISEAIACARQTEVHPVALQPTRVMRALEVCRTAALGGHVEQCGSPEQVLAYLGGYTHRVAISHQRLLNVQQGEVTFQWKDYRHRQGQKSRRMTLTPMSSSAAFSSTLPPAFKAFAPFKEQA